MSKNLPLCRKSLITFGKRTTLQAFAGTLVMVALAASSVNARDDYPTRPVQMITPFSAGGPTDIVGRVMGAKMGELLGRQFVVETRPAPVAISGPRPLRGQRLMATRS